MKTYSHDRRKMYDLDYFATGGIERRKGSWDRRSGKDRRSCRYRRSAGDRRLSCNPKYMFIPEKLSDEDRKRISHRRLRERRSDLDRSKVQTIR